MVLFSFIVIRNKFLVVVLDFLNHDCISCIPCVFCCILSEDLYSHQNRLIPEITTVVLHKILHSFCLT